MTRDLFGGMGLAVPSRKAHKDEKELISKGFRNLFVTSWRGLSLVGTFYTDYEGDPDALSVSPEEVSGFIEEFNQTYPAAGLTYDDVKFTFMGLQPKAPGNSSGGEPVCEKHFKLIDHSRSEKLDGLITALGVKWTTARDVAERAIDIAAQKLGKQSTPCRTHKTMIFGAPEDDPQQTLLKAQQNKPGWADDALISHLFATYGTGYTQVLDLAEADPTLQKRLSDDLPTIEAQVVYAVRSEMAMTLLDVIFQRIDIGLRGFPGDDCIERCAQLMAQAIGWSDAKRLEQIELVKIAYKQRGLKTT